MIIMREDSKWCKLLVLSLLFFSSVVTGCHRRVDTAQISAQDKKDLKPVTQPVKEPTGISEDVLTAKPTTTAPELSKPGRQMEPMGTSSTNLDADESAIFGSVYFEYDKSMIDSEGRKVILESANALKQNRNLKIRIEGYCDERGTNEYNLALGDRRAVSVKKYLMELGVEEHRIITISFGEEKALCSESKESCWSRNRRAQIVRLGDMS